MTTNYLFAGGEFDKLYHMSGEFTATLKASLDVSLQDANPRGITYTGSQILWLGASSKKIWQQSSGIFNSTVVSSLDTSGVDDFFRGLSYDGTDVFATGASADKLFRLDGVLSATVNSSIAVNEADPRDISWDGTDSYFTGATDDKLMRQSARFASGIKDSLDVSGVDTGPVGISFQGTHTPWLGNQSVKIYLQSGKFDTQLKDSESWAVTPGDDVPWGMEFDDFNTRTGASAAEDGTRRQRQLSSFVRTTRKKRKAKRQRRCQGGDTRWAPAPLYMQTPSRKRPPLTAP